MVEQLTDRQRSATIEPASVEEAADGATVQSLAAELAELRGQIDAAVAVGVREALRAAQGSGGGYEGGREAQRDGLHGE